VGQSVRLDHPEPGAGSLGKEVAVAFGNRFDKRASRFVRGLALPVSLKGFTDLIDVVATKRAGADEMRNQGCSDGFGHGRSMPRAPLFRQHFAAELDDRVVGVCLGAVLDDLLGRHADADRDAGG
jgi:hypothetical protein